ncbi:hypothetical protein ACWDG1_09440 [Streptomyces sp. NPDC001177]
MIERITVGAAAVMAALVGYTHLGRWAVTEPKPRREGRHRSAPELVSLDELLGPPSPYLEFEHASGVIRQGFDFCEPCDRTTAGVLTRDGWTCGECLTPAGGVR